MVYKGICKLQKSSLLFNFEMQYIYISLLDYYFQHFSILQARTIRANLSWPKKIKIENKLFAAK